LRPGAFLAKAKVTFARSLRVNEKVVPPHAFPVWWLMTLGSLLPSRHLVDDSRAEEMTGALGRAVENTDTLASLMFAVASRRPSGLNATDSTPDGVEKGEPARGLSAPVIGFTENSDTLCTGWVSLPYTSVTFPAASSPPRGLNATEATPDPVRRAALGSRNGEPATALSAPVLGSTQNIDTLPANRFAVASKPPPGLNATEYGPDPVENGEVGPGPVENGEPATGLNPPVVGLTANTDTLLAPTFAVARRPPSGLNATELDPIGFENGEPATALNAPVLGLTENTEMLPEFAVASRSPRGLNATDAGPWLDPDPVANGEPVTALNTPVLRLTENTETTSSVMPVVASRPSNCQMLWIRQ
jgi:hypothetical protein